MRMKFKLAFISMISMLIALAHSFLPRSAFALPDVLSPPEVSGSANIITTVISWGDHIASWVLALLGTVLTTYVIRKLLKGKVAEIIERTLVEIVDAVLEVKQTYVDSLKASALDGKLTSDERKEARDKAIKIAMSNLGVKGLARLGKILGVESLENWFSTKVESAIGKMKLDYPEVQAKPLPVEKSGTIKTSVPQLPAR